MARPYRDVRKDYINARSGVLSKTLRGSFRDAKEAACREFDELVQEQRRIAVSEALAQIALDNEGCNP